MLLNSLVNIARNTESFYRKQVSFYPSLGPATAEIDSVAGGDDISIRFAEDKE